MSLLRLFGSLIGGTASVVASAIVTDRYGHDRKSGGGPRVKNGPNGGLLRARNKKGNWRRKHKFGRK
jgi:hypothetical protein